MIDNVNINVSTIGKLELIRDLLTYLVPLSQILFRMKVNVEFLSRIWMKKSFYQEFGQQQILLNDMSRLESLEVSCTKYRLNSNLLLAIVSRCPQIVELTLDLGELELENDFVKLPQEFKLAKLRNLTLLNIWKNALPVVNSFLKCSAASNKPLRIQNYIITHKSSPWHHCRMRFRWQIQKHLKL